MGETEIIDELRVIISRRTVRLPISHFLLKCVQGSTGSACTDPRTVSCSIRIRRHSSSFAEHDTRATRRNSCRQLSFAGQYLRNVTSNLQTFLGKDFHMKSGMKFLIESFYRSIVDGTPEPIPYREILLTARIMEAIFKSLSESVVEPTKLCVEEQAATIV